MEATEKLERSWAIVELFGHQKIAGQVEETSILGGGFLRVDVPGDGAEVTFTRFYSKEAIYSLTPVSEDVARLAAKELQTRPVTVWIPTARFLPAHPTLPPACAPEELDDYEEPDDYEEGWQEA